MRYTKIISALAAVSLLASCADAGKISETVSDDISESSVTAELSEVSDAPKADVPQFTDCYKPEALKIPDGAMYICDVIAFDNSDMIIVSAIPEGHGDVVYFKTDRSFSAYEEFEFEVPEEAESADNHFISPFFCRNGSCAVILTIEDHGGLKLPKDRNEDFDYETYYNNCISQYRICRYDENGKLLSQAPFEYPEEFFSDDGYTDFRGYAFDGKNIIFTDKYGTFWKLSENGEFTKLFTAEIGNSELNSVDMFCDRDGVLLGNMVTSVITEDNSYSFKNTLFEIADGGFKEISSTSDGSYEFYEQYITGIGKYRYFISTEDGLYGITDEGEKERVVDWMSSNTDQKNITVLSESEFISCKENEMYRLTPRDLSEFANAQVITIACPNPYVLSEQKDTINKFNSSQDKYILRIMDVPNAVSEDGTEIDTSAFNMMLVSGEVPDIIFGVDYSTFTNYRKKGIFADLYELMDSDDSFSRDELLENILKLIESPDGRLYGISGTFGVQSLFTKSSAWDKENWTIDEFIDLHDNAPDSYQHLYDGSTNMEMLRSMTYAMTDFVDWENSVCSFDNPEFVKLLEFCGRYVNEVIMPDKSNDSEFSQYWTDKSKWLANDQILFEPTNVLDYNFSKYYQADGADITLAGFPTSDRKGGIVFLGSLVGISAVSEHKDAAWEFLKFYLKSPKTAEYGLPVVSKEFDKLLDKRMTETVTYSGNAMPKFDQATRDLVSDYIRSCSRLGTSNDGYFGAFDSDIMSVIEEEAALYFGGEQSSEKAAENIQSRLSILISEQS